jgi:hypothetical protein
MRPPEFALLPLETLKEHEEVDRVVVHALIERIRTDGFVLEPIWVARGTGVILNGHHRYHALVAMGARRAPAWVFDYDDPDVVLERWTPGPPVTKALVVERARAGAPFPPKTTKHVLRVALPERVTALNELLAEKVPAHSGAGRPSRSAPSSDGAR